VNGAACESVGPENPENQQRETIMTACTVTASHTGTVDQWGRKSNPGSLNTAKKRIAHNF